VLLVQRARDASLMAGMWELPEMATRRCTSKPSLTAEAFDHGDGLYSAGGEARDAPDCVGENGFPRRLGRVALTGLARKILRKAENDPARRWAIALTGLARKILREAELL
jgi:hypothetical protein